MTTVRTMVLDQLAIAWSLLEHHLDGLTDDECLWRPASRGLHVRKEVGRWVADWPDRETYDLGPPSIAWVTWHMVFWWSMAHDHAFGDATLTREDVTWPGGADAVRGRLRALHRAWVDALGGLEEEDFRSAERCRWPFSSRPFHDVCLWLNLELMKNAAEVGHSRFLHAVRREST